MTTTARRGVSRIPVKSLEWAVVALMAILCFDVLWGVFSRDILHNQSSWTEEVATVALIWISFLGAALGFASKAHLGVDYLVGKMDPSARRFARGVSYSAVLFFAAVVLLYGGASLVSKTLEMEQMMASLRVPKGWVYMALPISGAFICFFSIENLIAVFRGETWEEDEAEARNPAERGEHPAERGEKKE
jgi:TRAP-type C4-dicarboxylate transport system permease small subunit